MLKEMALWCAMMTLWGVYDVAISYEGEENMLREAEKYKNVKAIYVRFLLKTEIDIKPVTDMLSKNPNITHTELLEDGRLLFVYDFGEAPGEKEYDDFDTFVDEFSELFGYGDMYSFDYSSRKYIDDAPTFFGCGSPKGLLKKRVSAEFMEGYYDCTLPKKEWKLANSYMDYIMKTDYIGIALRDIEKQKLNRGMYMRFELCTFGRKDAERTAEALKSLENILYTEDIYEHTVIFILYVDDPFFNDNEIYDEKTIKEKRESYIKANLHEFREKINALTKDLSIDEYELDGVDSNKGSYNLNVYFRYLTNRPDDEKYIIASDEEINAMPYDNPDKRWYKWVSKSKTSK